MAARRRQPTRPTRGEWIGLVVRLAIVVVLIAVPGLFVAITTGVGGFFGHKVSDSMIHAVEEHDPTRTSTTTTSSLPPP